MKDGTLPGSEKHTVISRHNARGSTVDSYLLGLKYIAAMDAYFDYKAERQSRIEEVKTGRANRVHF